MQLVPHVGTNGSFSVLKFHDFQILNSKERQRAEYYDKACSFLLWHMFQKNFEIKITIVQSNSLIRQQRSSGGNHQ